MKYVMLSYDHLIKMLTKKTFALLGIAVFVSAVLPLLLTNPFGLSDAQAALAGDYYALKYLADFETYLMLFFPIFAGVCYAAFYTDSIAKGREYVYLVGGVKRLHLFLSKLIAMLLFFFLIYSFCFFVFDLFFLLLGGTTHLAILSFVCKIVLNSTSIAVVTILLANTGKNILISLIPSVYYYVLHFTNSSLGNRGESNAVFQVMHGIMPIFIFKESALPEGIGTDMLTLVRSPLYVVGYITVVAVLAHLSYRKADL